MARLERFELPTFWFVARHSIQLSYRRAENETDGTRHAAECRARIKAERARLGNYGRAVAAPRSAVLDARAHDRELLLRERGAFIAAHLFGDGSELLPLALHVVHHRFKEIGREL